MFAYFPGYCTLIHLEGKAIADKLLEREREY